MVIGKYRGELKEAKDMKRYHMKPTDNEEEKIVQGKIKQWINANGGETRHHHMLSDHAEYIVMSSSVCNIQNITLYPKDQLNDDDPLYPIILLLPNHHDYNHVLSIPYHLINLDNYAALPHDEHMLKHNCKHLHSLKDEINVIPAFYENPLQSSFQLLAFKSYLTHKLCGLFSSLDDIEVKPVSNFTPYLPSHPIFSISPQELLEHGIVIMEPDTERNYVQTVYILKRKDVDDHVQRVFAEAVKYIIVEECKKVVTYMH